MIIDNRLQGYTVLGTNVVDVETHLLSIQATSLGLLE